MLSHSFSVIQSGHKCGDNVDLIDRQPTGAIRVSFGYMSTHSDVTKLIDFIKESFVERHVPLPIMPKSCGELNCTDNYLFWDGTDFSVL